MKRLRGYGRPILYLDYDGSLHPEDVFRHPKRGIYLAPKYCGHTLFEHAHILADELAAFPTVSVVLSTSWVRVLGYSRAASYLPPGLRERVIGATYHSAMSDDVFLDLGRGLQILGDVGRRKPSAWIALDDDDTQWQSAFRNHLLKTDPVLGLTPVRDSLRAWLEAVNHAPTNETAGDAQAQDAAELELSVRRTPPGTSPGLEALSKLLPPMSDAEASVIAAREWLAEADKLPQSIRNDLWEQMERNSRAFLSPEEWQALRGCREWPLWCAAISEHFARRRAERTRQS